MFIVADALPTGGAIGSSIDSVARLFPIVLALAVGEAFKQFVPEKSDANRRIRWDRGWALAAFLTLVVPFFHGMLRYLFDTYQAGSRPDPYWRYVMIDSVAFTVEAAMFFILSRSLDPQEWPTFYGTVLALLGIDIAWGIWVAALVNSATWNWVFVNIAAGVLLAILYLLAMRRRKRDVPSGASLPRVIARVGVVILIARTVADYGFNMNFYFPKESQTSHMVASPSRGARALSKPVIYIASPYSKGDPAMNTHFQCKMFDRMLTDGKVWPVAPLWSHFQHTVFPRPYRDWLTYDKALLPRYDGCLRLTASLDNPKYSQSESSGADEEVAVFKAMGKPVFESLEGLYKWADTVNHQTPP